MKIDGLTYKLSDKGNFGNRALMMGAAGLLLSALGYFVDSDQFYRSYLVAFSFWVTLGLGGLFFVMLHHLTNATWSVVLRRLAESVMMGLPFIVIFFIPVALGLSNLYHWSNAEVVGADTLLQKKAPYLNSGFFLFRTLLYFLIWFLIGRALYRTSQEQDKEHKDRQVLRMRRISAPGMLLLAPTLTFAAFDWLMSLDALWYSTIFGVYVFSGSLVTVLSFIILMAIYLRKKGVLEKAITIEHYHDLGKLAFAFIIFWAYIAFSQYFLIWYANIPEETIWFHHRWQGLWKVFSLLLVFGHFVIPFLVLISRSAKRNLTTLKVVAVWLLLMHWVDLYWIILPSFKPHGASLSWMDLTTMMGVGGFFLWFFWSRFTSGALVPVNDPRLETSISFTNI